MAIEHISTRNITMPDGTIQKVRLTPDLWEDVDFLRSIEGITAEELVPFAMEEMQLQPGGITFDYAYRIVVVHLIRRWHN